MKDTNFSRLRTELKIKDLIIKELVVILSNNKIVLPEKLLENIKTLYNIKGDIKQ